MANQVACGIAMAEARHIVASTEGGTAAKLKAAMRACLDHWMAIEESDQLYAAVGSVVEYYGLDSAEGQKLAAEMRWVSKMNLALSAILGGIDVSTDAVLNEQPADCIGILSLWREVKQGRHR